MNRPNLLLSAILFFATTSITFAQDSLLTSLARNNVTTFTKNAGTFSGAGWEKILKQATASNDVLIGEDHFTNEIPYFTSAIASRIKFENFFCEIDPFTAEILQGKIKSLSQVELQRYADTYGNAFSFYAFAPEFELLKQLSKSNTTIRGTDQILLIGDRIICNELQQTTRNKEAKQLYKLIADSSKLYFDKFLKDQHKPFYLLTDDFAKNIDRLSLLKLSTKETTIIDALKLSARIYKSQNHEMRVQLMKNQLMKVYSSWYGKRNLFKYGANHLTKGESLLDVYDIGNLISNINDADFKSSLHIMILGISGSQASPFEGFPAENIDPNSSVLKILKPITKIVDGEQWYCFDLLPLRKELNGGRLKITNIKMQRIIKGYDLLVIIPKVTAGRFVKKQ